MTAADVSSDPTLRLSGMFNRFLSKSGSISFFSVARLIRSRACFRPRSQADSEAGLPRRADIAVGCDGGGSVFSVINGTGAVVGVGTGGSGALRTGSPSVGDFGRSPPDGCRNLQNEPHVH